MDSNKTKEDNKVGPGDVTVLARGLEQLNLDETPSVSIDTNESLAIEVAKNPVLTSIENVDKASPKKSQLQDKSEQNVLQVESPRVKKAVLETIPIEEDKENLSYMQSSNLGQIMGHSYDEMENCSNLDGNESTEVFCSTSPITFSPPHPDDRTNLNSHVNSCSEGCKCCSLAPTPPLPGSPQGSETSSSSKDKATLTTNLTNDLNNAKDKELALLQATREFFGKLLSPVKENISKSLESDVSKMPPRPAKAAPSQTRKDIKENLNKTIEIPTQVPYETTSPVQGTNRNVSSTDLNQTVVRTRTPLKDANGQILKEEPKKDMIKTQNPKPIPVIETITRYDINFKKIVGDETPVGSKISPYKLKLLNDEIDMCMNEFESHGDPSKSKNTQSKSAKSTEKSGATPKSAFKTPTCTSQSLRLDQMNFKEQTDSKSDNQNISTSTPLMTEDSTSGSDEPFKNVKEPKSPPPGKIRKSSADRSLERPSHQSTHNAGPQQDNLDSSDEFQFVDYDEMQAATSDTFHRNLPNFNKATKLRLQVNKLQQTIAQLKMEIALKEHKILKLSENLEPEGIRRLKAKNQFLLETLTSSKDDFEKLINEFKELRTSSLQTIQDFNEAKKMIEAYRKKEQLYISSLYENVSNNIEVRDMKIYYEAELTAHRNEILKLRQALSRAQQK